MTTQEEIELKLSEMRELQKCMNDWYNRANKAADQIYALAMEIEDLQKAAS